MSITNAELAKVGKTSIDNYLKNSPVDQINTKHPLLKKLMAGKKPFPGGTEFVVEQLTRSNDSNFQWFSGAQAVTYNNRNVNEQAKYAWGSNHDGFFIDEDFLLRNGITIDDDKGPRNATDSERVQLVNVLETQNTALRSGWEDAMDYALHLDGTQDAEAIAGTDHLVGQTPATGVIGGIDASVAANAYWRNYANLAVPKASLLQEMEKAYRYCTTNGDTVPDCIIMGQAVLDVFAEQTKTEVGRYQVLSNKGEAPTMDPSYTGLQFKGIPVIWDPMAAKLDADLTPTHLFERRVYFYNTHHLKLRPAQGHDMISRKPPRSHDRYVHYFALTWKGALTTNRRNAHALLVWNGS